MTTRADIVRVARTYIETPFAHMARLPGVGLDCAGVIVCVSRELGLVEPDFDEPPYMPTPDGRKMVELCNRYMTPVAEAAMQPGDAILLITDVDPQHLGILGDYLYGGFSIIHAANDARPPRVIETRLMYSRALRF